jgi:hypothetical protein
MPHTLLGYLKDVSDVIGSWSPEVLLTEGVDDGHTEMIKSVTGDGLLGLIRTYSSMSSYGKPCMRMRIVATHF